MIRNRAMKIPSTYIYSILLLNSLWFINACDTAKSLSNNSTEDSKTVIDTVEFDKSSRFSYGIARVEKDSNSYFIKTNGQRSFKNLLREFHPLDSVVAANNGMVRSYSNEEKIMRIVETESGKVGMLNEKGEWIINPKYEKIAFVFNRYLKIEADGKTTYADSWGNFLVPLKFEDIQFLNDELFDVRKDGKWGVYNSETDNIIIPFEYDKFDYCSGCGQKSDYLYAKKDGKWGVIDFKSEVLVPFKYQHQHVNMRSDEWVAAFRKSGKNVVINIPQKKEFSAPQYENLLIENGHLIASKNSGETSNFGLINRNGKEIVPFQYSHISNPYSSFKTGAYFSVEKDGKFGIIDTLGNVIIPPTYKNRLLVRDDYFISRKQKKMGLINKENKQLLPSKFDWLNLNEIRTNAEELTPIFKMKSDGKYGYYFPINNKLVKPEYDRIEFFNDRQRNPSGAKPIGLMSLEKDGKEKLYNINSDKLIPGDYAAFEFKPHHKVILMKENYGDQGLYDLKKERYIIPIKYKYIKVFNDQNKLIKVEKDIGNSKTQAGLFADNGKEILPVTYTDIKQIDSTYFLLQKDSLYQLFNAKNHTKENLPFTKVTHSFNSSLLIAQQEDKVYFYNYKTQKLLLKNVYSSIQQLKNGTYLVTKKQGEFLKFGYVNAEGEVIVPLVYDMLKADYLLNFQDENYLPLFKKDESSEKLLEGFADLDGKILVPAKFQKVWKEESGNGFLTMNNNRFGIITAEGKEILDSKIDVYLNSPMSPYRDTSNFSFPVAFKEDGIWQFMNEDGKILPIRSKEIISSQQ
ncbi:WG repeat-containing protein [Zunongwangia endophytica]|uniref:WG repeat-containing protein n=1 Tax=Zunongwangia endophytica TaxID=1808945 RepID=A0ABV8HGA1_9FLAO|nr:WG repeat-containing protein [Zunongwangia endophytica]MDN3594671.1 WG repeat-containing protein [Zunongwangia endophytica]